jgi:hypothetical protein
MFFHEERLPLFVFKYFLPSGEAESLFKSVSVRHITRQPEFFGAIALAHSHLEADRDHDGT